MPVEEEEETEEVLGMESRFPVEALMSLVTLARRLTPSLLPPSSTDVAFPPPSPPNLFFFFGGTGLLDLPIPDSLFPPLLFSRFFKRFGFNFLTPPPDVSLGEEGEARPPFLAGC